MLEAGLGPHLLGSLLCENEIYTYAGLLGLPSNIQGIITSEPRVVASEYGLEAARMGKRGREHVIGEQRKPVLTAGPSGHTGSDFRIWVVGGESLEWQCSRG